MTHRGALVASLALAASACGRSSLLDEGEGGGPFGPRDLRGADLTRVDLGGADLTRADLVGIDLTAVDLDVPCGERPEVCTNGMDDNCNGLVDCKDPQCAGDKACIKPGQEICNNGIDDDNNGKVDCDDVVCANFPGCQPHMCNDMNPDCADPACVNHPKCKNLVCKPTVDFGTMQKNDSKSTKTVDTKGTMDVATTPCAPGGGGMVVTEFTVAANNTSVRMDFMQAANGDHTFALFREGIGQKCDANSLGCYDPKSAPSGTTTWTLQAGHYFLIVQAFTAKHQGSVTVTLTTPPAAKPEICANGADDDGNGLIDCADPACFGKPECKTKSCTPDLNVGTLVVGDPPKNALFSTKASGSELLLGCAAGKGNDYVVQFSMKETAGVQVRWSQQGDHVLALFQKPPAGQACDAIPLGCYDPSGRQMDWVAWGELPPGDYLFVWQALKPGGEGNVQAQISAYRNRKIELCHNNIDDDGDGLIDCNDPDCFPDPGCGAPICMPDVNLGTLHLGQSASTMLDVTKGIPNLKVSCAKGGAKSRVVEVTLAQNAGMGFECTMMGDHVLGLFAAAGFRDPCDKTELVCGDPKVIPFGCNYEIPNLQPGTYYVIVQGFQAGSEGRVNLTLSSIRDRALEICNNMKDDDGDGFTDCADRKCATSPYCVPKACKPDATIDPMPINGMAVFKLIQTAGQQVTAQPPCQDKPGGGNAVIGINLPAKANLRVDWAQIGNHVFAIYPNLGNGLVCEAGKVAGCVKSNNMGNGFATFGNLAAGKYWFIVAAASPGQEGSASLKFTAMP